MNMFSLFGIDMISEMGIRTWVAFHYNSYAQCFLDLSEVMWYPFSSELILLMLGQPVAPFTNMV